MPFADKNWSFRLVNVSSQLQSLAECVRLAKAGKLDPIVRATAVAIVRDCDARDDMCELRAIFDAVKSGNSDVEGLESGVRYVSDPDSADYFIAPKRLLELCKQGACAGDCDDQSMLVAALAGALGFVSGLRIYAVDDKSDYEHIYAVVGFPKHNPTKFLGMDTTVDYAEVGWEPPPGKVLTALLDPEGYQ